jgi:hypothetical protein
MPRGQVSLADAEGARIHGYARLDDVTVSLVAISRLHKCKQSQHNTIEVAVSS